MRNELSKQASHEVHRVLNGFLHDLDSQISDQEFENLLFGKTRLTDVELGYKPEAYTRLNLVEPLIQAVHLEYQLEPRSEGVSRKRWPDFEITSTAIPYIGEIKAMNTIEPGVEEIKEYLGVEGFVSPYGILTDGVEWAIFGPPKDGGRTSNPIERRRLSLADALKTVALSEGYWDKDFLSSRIQSTGVKQIEEFPSIFHPDQIDAWALQKMPQQYRQEFLSEKRSLQTSLEGGWK